MPYITYRLVKFHQIFFFSYPIFNLAETYKKLKPYF